MTAKFYLFCLILWLKVFSLSITGKAQVVKFDQWNLPQYYDANSAKSTDYLSDNEKHVIFYLNLARMNGPLFAKTYLKAYLDSTKKKSNKWIRSLESDLKDLKPMKPLLPAKDLFEEAVKHAKDMGKSGKMGHYTSSGKNFNSRFKSLSIIYSYVAENCDYGNNDPWLIVFSLLIDEGIENLGHRKNILNPDFEYIGVSIQPHKKFNFNCVMDFGKK